MLGDPRRQKHDAMEFVSEFSLSKPGESFWWPDKHSFVIFTLEQLDRDKLVLRYEHSFADVDGERVIDSGEVTLFPFQSE